MRNRAAIVSLLAVLTAQTVSSAQIARLYDTRYSFPHSQINRTYQDRNGFIWICSENGLTRFDGRHFRTFSYNASAESDIASSNIQCMTEDSMGRTWVGTARGLQLFNRSLGTFDKFDFGDPENTDPSVFISDITEVNSGVGRNYLLAATSGRGIYFIDENTLEVDMRRTRTVNSELSSLRIGHLFLDSDDRLWVASSLSDLDVFNLATDVRLDIPGMEAIRTSATVTCIQEDMGSGKIFIATNNDGIFVYDRKISGIRRAADPAARSISVRSMIQGPVPQSDRSDVMILGTATGGFLTMDTQSETVMEMPMNNIRYDTGRWKIHSLMRDVQGNLWAGVYQKGLFVMPQSMFGFEYEPFDPDGSGSGKSECVTSIAEDDRGGIWFGSYGFGLIRKNADGTREHLDTSNSGLVSDSILAMVTDDSGTIWFASDDEGVFSYSREYGFRRFRDQNAIGTLQCNTAAFDRNSGLLYIGTVANGFCIIDPRAGKVLKVVPGDFSTRSTCMTSAPDGTVWVGTYHGLCRYDRENDGLIRINPGAGNGNSRVFSVICRSDGKVLAGCASGLIEYNPADKSTRLFTKEDGLCDNSVVGVIEDNDGSLWVSTLNGLTHISHNMNSFSSYYQNDGLQDNQFYPGACFKAENGQMYFGGIEGVSAFGTGAGEIRNHITPGVFFTGLALNGTVIGNSGNDWKGILDKSITEASQITLPYSGNSFSVLFNMPEYTNPMRAVYSCRLLGAGKEWIRLENQARSVTYANLSHGKYRLQVRAYIDGEPDKYSMKEIDIRIKAPVWLSVWAFLLCLAVLCAGGYLFVRKRKRTESGDMAASAGEDRLSSAEESGGDALPGAETVQEYRTTAQPSSGNLPDAAGAVTEERSADTAEPRKGTETAMPDRTADSMSWYEYNDADFSPSDKALVGSIISVIRENMANSDFSVEDLSKKMGMSRVHLNRRLKETVNVSPSAMIKSIRLRHAAYLLINGKVNVSEVASLVGFSTHSYFSISFREYFGMTPKEFMSKFGGRKDSTGVE